MNFYKTFSSILLLSFGLSATPLAAQDMQPQLNQESAWAIIAGCEAHAEENNLRFSIAVFDNGGNLKAFQRMDGSTLASIRISQWKGYSAASFPFSTKRLGDISENLPGLARAPEASSLEGGLPIYTEDGHQIGGVGVSGASAVQDAECAAAGLAVAGLNAGEAG